MKFAFVFGTAVLLTLTGSLRGQDSDVAQLRREMEEMKRQMAEQKEMLERQNAVIEELRAQVKAAPRDGAGETPAPRGAGVPAGPGAGEKAKADSVEITASFKDGLKMKSADGNFTIDIGGRMEIQSRTFLSDNPGADTFFIREARIQAEGSFYKEWGYKVQYDFSPSATAGMSTPRLREGFVEWRRYPEFSLRTGQWKEPFSLQQTTSSRFIDFVERAVPDRLVPSYDLGVAAYGKPWDPYLSYEIGLFNGNGFNTTDANDDKDLAARLQIRPFAGAESRWVKGLMLGGAVTTGNQTGSFGSISSPSTNTTFLTLNPGVTARGERTRWGGELAWIVGPFKLQGEYLASTVDLKRSSISSETREIDFDGWYLQGLYVLTGEEVQMQRRRPSSRFLEEGGWGQWEAAARYARFDSDAELTRTAASGGSALVSPTGSTRGLDEWTIGLNWWPNPNTRISLDWVRNEFDRPVSFGGGADPEDREDALLMRFQIDF
ncbi:MAG: hypothetical protein HYY93_05420 [Planctomycetes bacterium]|nr:hypothetical protein [Planctomycetota bacterium]